MGTVNEDIYPFKSPGGKQLGVVNQQIIASTTAMPAPAALITTVSGTVAVTTIALPWAGFTGFIIYVPTGAFTGATGGTADDTNKPIGKAFTAVVARALIMIYDGVTWYPAA